MRVANGRGARGYIDNSTHNNITNNNIHVYAAAPALRKRLRNGDIRNFLFAS
jgi:hypothetical protein